MDENDSGRSFQTTSWTLIFNARSDERDLEELLKRYWSPIYAYLRRRGHDYHAATDLTQEFLVTVFLRRDLVGTARPDRGRFRSYLIAALKNFLVDEHRRTHGRSGASIPSFVPGDPREIEKLALPDEQDPAEVFDRQWAVSIFNRSLVRLEESCRHDGLERHWAALLGRFLRPVLECRDPPPLEQLARDLGVERPEDVSSMLHTVKRKFRALFRDTIAETIEDPSELESEIQILRSLLSRGWDGLAGR